MIVKIIEVDQLLRALWISRIARDQFRHPGLWSAYLKVHRAAEFFACLLNNQPMGFYSSATLVKDAQRHGIRMRPVCVRASEWRCTVEADDTVRLGFCVVNGLREENAVELVRQKKERPFASLDDFKTRISCLTKEELRRLAEAGALNRLANHRRNAMWEVEETWHADLLGSASRRGGRKRPRIAVRRDSTGNGVAFASEPGGVRRSHR